MYMEVFMGAKVFSWQMEVKKVLETVLLYLVRVVYDKNLIIINSCFSYVSTRRSPCMKAVW